MKKAIFKNILTSRVYEVAKRTPLEKAIRSSVELNNDIYIKREDLQSVYSFKIRGAYNKIANLQLSEQEAGVICASAGNHAQGVALSAMKLGLKSTVVMPRTTPLIKVNAVKNFGSDVRLHGDNYTEAADYCTKLRDELNATFIHPFDDPLTIAGQGTIAHEVLQQCPNMDYFFVPVGGGGLISGIATYLKELRPEIKIVGVEPLDSDTMSQSIATNSIVTLDEVGIFSDGVAVKRVGDLTFELCKTYVDDWIQISIDEICSAIKSIYSETRTIVEPAGAISFAGMIKCIKKQHLKNKKLVTINSGANMNFDRLRFVAERTRVGEEKEVTYAVTIPEQAGSLKNLCEKVVGDHNITSFNYRLSGRKNAHILLSLGIDNKSDKKEIESALENYHFEFEDLTKNELAKTHIKHMVGGHSEKVRNEVLIRFTFPERANALSDLLLAMSENWNISLFQYKLDGGAFGRVLIGFEILLDERIAFQSVLKNINYPYVDESENKAYKLFL